MKQILNVSYAFVRLADSSLEVFAHTIWKEMDGNPAYPSPPVTMLALKSAADAFSGAIAASLQGGTIATAEKRNARASLIVVLRKLADYVQTVHGNDLSVLLSSGFEATSTNRARVTLAMPQISRVKNGREGQLLVTVGRDPNVKCFELRYASVAADGSPGAWQSGGFSTKSRNMELNGLTPGQMYRIEVRAIGGAAGHSDWSDSVDHRSL